jgi:hypothetical protein
VDGTAPDFLDGSDYNDLENVLNYYWLIKSDNVADFDGRIETHHNNALEQYDNTQGLDLSNYAPARLLNDSSEWDKRYSIAQFDETNNISYFQLSGLGASGTDYADLASDRIQGRYTAGITRSDGDIFLCGGAIPNTVPEFVTSNVGSGTIDQGASFVGGVAPDLSSSPDIKVSSGFELTVTDKFWQFRKVTIEEGATLTVLGAGVNLGTVAGNGNIKLVDGSSFPAGDFEEFFPDATCGSGGGVEYSVTTGSQTVLSGISVVKNVVMSGDGSKQLANNQQCLICENLTLTGNGQFELNDSALKVQRFIDRMEFGMPSEDG